MTHHQARPGPGMIHFLLNPRCCCCHWSQDDTKEQCLSPRNSVSKAALSQEAMKNNKNRMIGREEWVEGPMDKVIVATSWTYQL